MLDRIWWFVAGLVAGAVVTVRALGRKPGLADLRAASTVTAADVLALTARLVRPKNP
ncbi:MAG: hypothetical protein ACT4OP_01425 [Actinomycetota bacterium]